MEETKGYVHENEFPHVYVARDTRESSPELLDCLLRGLECMRVPYTNYDIVTYPVLNYLVANYKLSRTVDNYIETFTSAFNEFMSLITIDNRHYDRRMIVDCANGAGSHFMPQIAERIA